MPEDLSTKILDVRPTPFRTDKGAFVAGVTVAFMVGTHGEYTMSFPQEGFTAQVAKAAIEAKAQEIRLLLS